jgi:LPXTG-motif cell wall-anchored protein
MRKTLVAVAAALSIILGGVALFPQLASATDITIAWSKGCTAPDSGIVFLTAHLHNTYSQPLTVKISDPASPYNHTLQPGATYDATYTTTTAHAAGTATMTVTPTNGGILVGTASDSVSWTKGECLPTPVDTTVPTTPPTTDCAHAIPPRTDCGSTPPPTVKDVTTVPVTTVDTTPVTTAPESDTTVTQAPHHHTTTTPTTAAPELPHTGSGATPLIYAGLGTLLAGAALVLITRRRATV